MIDFLRAISIGAWLAAFILLTKPALCTLAGKCFDYTLSLMWFMSALMLFFALRWVVMPDSKIVFSLLYVLSTMVAVGVVWAARRGNLG